MCRATSEILTGGEGEHLWWEWVSLASPVGYRELCRLSVPICSPWLSCSTAVLSQRLFHSERKRTATHVLSALRWGIRSISAQWQAGLESDQQDVMWHMPGVTYNGTIILLAPLTLNGWIAHKTQQDLDTRGVSELKLWKCFNRVWYFSDSALQLIYTVYCMKCNFNTTDTKDAL